jgi:DNA-binding response OmpR family regulator
MKVLLAEDDQNIATVIQLVLSHVGGHEITIAQDGEEALNTALNDTYDLILLDGMMPKRNGVAVCKEYKARGGSAPVIFFSAKSQQSDIDEFLENGSGYIQKPFDPSTICDLINDILSQCGVKAEAV